MNNEGKIRNLLFINNISFFTYQLPSPVKRIRPKFVGYPNRQTHSSDCIHPPNARWLAWLKATIYPWINALELRIFGMMRFRVGFFLCEM